MHSTHTPHIVQRPRRKRRFRTVDAGGVARLVPMGEETIGETLADAARRELAADANKRRDVAPDAPLVSLEQATSDFREALAMKHASVAKAARFRYAAFVNEWRPFDAGAPLAQDAQGPLPRRATTAIVAEVCASEARKKKWHEGRAKGQRERFDRVRSCGVRQIVPWCVRCHEKRTPIPEGCGVRRVCERCDVGGAKQRRARFGLARGRVLADSARHGLLFANRKGGRFTEKMLTLTAPHFRRDDLEPGKLRDVSSSDVDARIAAVWMAWPLFLRMLNDAWARRDERGGTRDKRFVAYHRSFEWTPGHDGKGHPHFHVYMWCPFFPADLLREMWAHALREVGVPVAMRDGLSVISVDLRMLRGFNVQTIRELLKGGRRDWLRLSKVEFGGHTAAPLVMGTRSAPGIDAFKYADGWTLFDVKDLISLDVWASLYMALEARRLTQASRGFFAADARVECDCCGFDLFRVYFEATPPPAPFTLERAQPARAPP